MVVGEKGQETSRFHLILIQSFITVVDGIDHLSEAANRDNR